jgi:tRNA(fMet)-specific endonuclease VapC
VLLPREFRFERDRVRIRRVARGGLLEPLVQSRTEWFRKLDELSSEPFSRGRRQPVTPSAKPSSERSARHERLHSPDPRYAPVRSRFHKAVGGDAQIRVSAVVIFELWYGVAKSARPQTNRQRLETFLAGPIIVLPFDDEDARIAGSIRAALEVSGKPIRAYDVLIAGQALASQLTLVTVNLSEFSQVKGPRWQDWAKRLSEQSAVSGR